MSIASTAICTHERAGVRVGFWMSQVMSSLRMTVSARRLGVSSAMEQSFQGCEDEVADCATGCERDDEANEGIEVF